MNKKTGLLQISNDNMRFQMTVPGYFSHHLKEYFTAFLRKTVEHKQEISVILNT